MAGQLQIISITSDLISGTGNGQDPHRFSCLVAAKPMTTGIIGGLTVQYCGANYVRLAAVLYASGYREEQTKSPLAYIQTANAYFE